MTWHNQSQKHHDARMLGISRKNRPVFNKITFKKSEIPNRKFKEEQLIDGVIVEREHSNLIPARLAITKAHLSEQEKGEIPYYKHKVFDKEIKAVTPQGRERLRKEIQKYD